MADSDSVSMVSSSQSGDDESKRRCVTSEATNRYHSDKQMAGKHKTPTCNPNNGPEIGASYLVRRLDDTYRKLLLDRMDT